MLTDLCLNSVLWILYLQNKKLCANCSQMFTFFISEHFLLSAEHGFQQGVLSGQHLQCAVKQHPANIEANILVGQSHRPPVAAGLGLGTSQRRS